MSVSSARLPPGEEKKYTGPRQPTRSRRPSKTDSPGPGPPRSVWRAAGSCVCDAWGRADPTAPRGDAGEYRTETIVNAFGASVSLKPNSPAFTFGSQRRFMGDEAMEALGLTGGETRGSPSRSSLATPSRAGLKTRSTVAGAAEAGLASSPSASSLSRQLVSTKRTEPRATFNRAPRFNNRMIVSKELSKRHGAQETQDIMWPGRMVTSIDKTMHSGHKSAPAFSFGTARR